MKKQYQLENLGCANCAAKMEVAIGKIPGVRTVNISFLTRRLTVELDENLLPMIEPAMQSAIKKYEPDCRLLA